MTTPRKKRGWWITCGGDDGAVGTCTRCGGTLKLKLPMNLKAVCLYMKAFVAEHIDCKEPAK